MRLKKIELHGFKSFADRTVLEFDEGITGVVGPNGCGKSNISDAFQWVFGEQSAKSLRGGKMLDVIFAGTSTRNAMNYAEVTITLTDVGDSLPIDYDEVAITRRLHRSGESEYQINRQPVRLRDVKSLFLDSGLGKMAFKQGEVDKVIHLSPKERRSFFEEPAGILRFLERKKEALRDLNKTGDNMTRIRDIHHEVEKQLQTSERQAEQARKYKSNVAELENLEKAVSLAKFDHTAKRLDQAIEKESSLQLSLDDAKAVTELLALQLTGAKADLDRAELAFRERSEQVYKARSHREIQAKERQSNQERLKESSEKEEKYSKEIKEIRKKREAERVAAEHQKTRQQRLEKDLIVQEEALQVVSKRSKNLGDELNRLRELQQEAQKDRLQLVQDEGKVESQLKENKVRLENSQERLQGLAKRHAHGMKWGDELKEELSKKEATLKEISGIVEGKRDTLTQLETSLESLSKELAAKSSERELLSGELSEIRARQKALLRLKEDMEGLSTGTRALLRESKDAAGPLFEKLSPLHEVLMPEVGYETALAAVMRPYMQTLVVEKKKDFEKALEVAREMELNDFSILCIESLPAPSGAVATLESLVGHVVDHALSRHFFKNVYLSDDPQALVGAASVTKDGVLLDSKGVLFFTSQGENNIFLREAEIKSLGQRLDEVEAALAALAKSSEALQRKKAQFEIERSELDQTIRRSEMKQVEANFGVQQCRQELEKHESEFAAIAGDREKTELVVKELSASIADLSTRHETLHKRATERTGQLSKLEEDLKKATALYQEVEPERQESEAAYKSAYEELQNLTHLLKVFSVKEEEGFQQEERLQQEIQQLQELQKKLQHAEEKVHENLGSVEEELTGVEAECQALELEVKHWKSRIEHVDANTMATRDLTRALQEEKHQLGIKVAQLESQRNVVQQDLFERHQLTVDEARKLDLKLKLSLEDSEKKIRALRRDVDKAGDINMTAIKAFEEQKARHLELDKQIGDMEASQKELMEIISQLDGQSRAFFRETFAIIRDNFRKNFRILFNGGEADLTLTDSKDVLEAGIEIVAKPPGKKMRSIQLLSGGEKCLTAMALLFAIFEVKASPFCLLDEIDAPLDDSNVERFVAMVKEFTHRSQFVIITHNKRTMAIADTLFGVSMEERGVSKLLSMKFSDAEEYAEEPLATVH